MLDPRLELPDDTPIENIRLPSRIRNVLAAAGLKTVGEVRETTDATLLSFQDLGPALQDADLRH
jgi:DNA-directed RNA polymerase alpha subunit